MHAPRIRQFLLEEKGVSSIEYALLSALIAVVCVVALSASGTNLSALYGDVCNAVATAVGAGGGC